MRFENAANQNHYHRGTHHVQTLGLVANGGDSKRCPHAAGIQIEEAAQSFILKEIRNATYYTVDETIAHKRDGQQKRLCHA